MLVYDIEIVKAVPPKDPAHRIDGVQYCDGWRDFENMGVSVICAYSYPQDRYRVFMEDNFTEFEDLAAGDDCVIGFNSLSFDDRACNANGIKVSTDYDLLVETWKADGLPGEFSYPSHIGYGLDNLAHANLNARKSGHGALAPVHWQGGEIGKVVDYCLEDVRLTKNLIDQVIRSGTLLHPRYRDFPGKVLSVRPPWVS